METVELLDRLTPAGVRLLDAASELFYLRGIHAVGVELIAETAGTTKKTLYDRFGSKDALVALYLSRRALRWQEYLTGYLDENAPTPGAGRILAVFDALEAWHRDLDRGCAFVNAYAEVGGTEHPALPVIRADKQWMSRLFRTLAEEAGLDGADHVGEALHLLYEGATVARTAGAFPDATAWAKEAAARLTSAD